MSYSSESQSASGLSWEYRDRRYWDSVYLLDERHEEKVVTVGNDGENEFDTMILNASHAKIVLDVGCGDAQFTIKIAEMAQQVFGVDFSEKAISLAQRQVLESRRANVRVQVADAERLPFPDENFDLVVSRRGPVTDTMTKLSQVHRVLKTGGLLMGITIGERDKENITRIFGRGQMYGVGEKVSLLKERMLRESGFDGIEIRDYLATEIFGTVQDLMVRLKDSPIIPDFDVESDERYLDIVQRECKTERGIETEAHRVTLVARKRRKR